MLTVEFTVLGMPFLGLNGGPQFGFNEAIPFQVYTEDQAETDRYWRAIVEGGGSEGNCSWCKDRFGLSWQIVPRALMDALKSSDPWGRQAGDGRDDADEEDRYRDDRSGAEGLTFGGSYAKAGSGRDVRHHVRAFGQYGERCAAAGALECRAYRFAGIVNRAQERAADGVIRKRRVEFDFRCDLHECWLCAAH